MTNEKKIETMIALAAHYADQERLFKESCDKDTAKEYHDTRIGVLQAIRIMQDDSFCEQIADALALNKETRK